ncbi:thermonuclease family protein [Kiritimatiellaeota bacterium B1221]|nr:thermonuclease family protein [Kiritimatiellaeota bacterium B1221]
MRKLRNFQFGIWLVLLMGVPVQARVWTELDGVTFEENLANDGDSFHAKRNSSRYLFRLYFVDTPETDMRYPDRVQAQADYFGLTPEQVVKGAKEAAEYVRKLLKDKALTVHTRYSNARGASAMKRYYSMVEVEGRWLSEILIKQGYARVYGMGTELPDGTSQDKYWSRLRKLEKEAKEKHRGLWGLASGKLDLTQLKSGQEIKLPRATPIFHSAPPYQMVGQLPADWTVTLGPVSRPGFRQVRFISPGGANFTGDLQESALK